MSDQFEYKVEEEEVPKGVFNELVHEQTKDGDPQRNDDGSIRLKKNWKKVAVDRQGRTYNKAVHGEEQELDAEGFLKVRRREAAATVSTTGRTQAFVAKYQENGYAYYIANDEGGRLEQMQANDWEPVMDKDGPASLKVGQARSHNTQARLFKKPIEWYEADQNLKIERNKARYAQTTSPKEADGQYEGKAQSGAEYENKPGTPLR